MKRSAGRLATPETDEDLLLSLDEYVSMLDVRLKMVHAYQERSPKSHSPWELVEEWNPHQPIP